MPVDRPASHLMLGSLGLLACACVQAASSVTISAPANGMTVAPGSKVKFVVQVDQAAMPAEVHVATRAAEIQLAGSGLTFTGVLVVPAESAGPLKVLVSLTRPNGGGALSGGLATTILNVVPNDAPLRLEATRSATLDAPGTGRGLRYKLTVLGVYEGDIQRVLTSAVSGTTYTSSNTSVATVTANGEIQAVDAGNAVITVQNQGVKQFCKVTVRGATNTTPPPQDITSQFSISSSGIHLDPEARLYIQELTIRNTSSEPVFFPIRLVISALPSGVSVVNAVADTSTVAPLNSAVVSLRYEGDDNYVPPGGTATAVVKFANRDAVPILYDKRVFAGDDL